MPKLLFKVIGSQPEHAMGSQSKGLQWAFSLSVSPWYCFPTGPQFDRLKEEALAGRVFI